MTDGSLPVGIIGKRVKIPCGTAAVMAEFRFVYVTVGYTWEGKTGTMTPEPEDLPFVLYCRKGRNHKADGSNAFVINRRVNALRFMLTFLKLFGKVFLF